MLRSFGAFAVARPLGAVRFVAGAGAAIFLIAIGVPSLFATIDFLQHSERVEARVVSSAPHNNPNGKVSYCPVLSYTTGAGATLLSEAADVCEDSPFRTGETMPILYDTHDPTKIRVDSLLGIWGTPIFTLGTGALVAVLVVVVLVFRFAKPQSP